MIGCLIRGMRLPKTCLSCSRCSIGNTNSIKPSFWHLHDDEIRSTPLCSICYYFVVSRTIGHWAPGEIYKARATFEFSFILFLHLFSEDFPFPAPTPPLNSNLRAYNPPFFQ